MLEISKRNIKFLSRMGAQGSLGQAIYDLAVSKKQMNVLSADVGIPSGFDRIIRFFPELYIDTGIAEQNLVSISAGISDGIKPTIATTYSTFITYRAADQIRVFMGMMQKNIKLVGIGGGINYSYLGSSHYGLGDLAVTLSVPNIDVIAPADGFQIYKAVEAAVENDRPTYIRLTGGDTLPMIYNEVNCIFEIGKANVLADGSQIMIIGCGTILEQALKSAKELEEEYNLSCMVVDMHTLRPMDIDIIKKTKDFELIVTVEEHSTIGGLGNMVSKTMSDLDINTHLYRIGIDDFFPVAGSYDYLLKQCGIDSESLTKKIKEKYDRIK